MPQGQTGKQVLSDLVYADLITQRNAFINANLKAPNSSYEVTYDIQVDADDVATYSCIIVYVVSN